MYKTWTIALAVGGLLSVLVLLLWGRDLRRASRTGPVRIEAVLRRLDTISESRPS